MFPGISIPPDGLPSFVSGEPWSVKVPGNSAPIAVGTTTVSSAEALTAGLRGKALKIAHYYGDSLWDSVEGRYVPNEGFFEDVVVEDPNYSLPSQSLHASEEDLENNPVGDTMNNEESVDVSGSHNEDAGVPLETDIRTEIDEVLASSMSELKVTEIKPAEEASDEKEQHNLSVEEVDSLLDKCLLQALHTSVKDKDLPMLASTLWANHILPCRPPGVTLDIKKSSHKKLSKWLQSKSSSGLISAKEDKYKKEMMLLRINRGHADYISFKPEKRVQGGDDNRHENAIGESSSSNQFDVSEIYKSSAHVVPVLIAVEADTSKYYSASEASDIVFRYVEKGNLVKPTDKATVILDVTLCDALYKGAIKKGTMYPSEIHKKDLGLAFLNRMQVHHRVARGNEVVVRKGAIRAIQIMTERRQGNKKMTRVSGLESFLIDADSLASELQKKFACSTTTAELPGKKGQYEVLVQGGVIDNLAKHLVDQYGIPKRYIEVLDKTKK